MPIDFFFAMPIAFQLLTSFLGNYVPPAIYSPHLSLSTKEYFTDYCGVFTLVLMAP